MLELHWSTETVDHLWLLIYSRLISGFYRFYPAKPIYTLIALLLYFPSFGDICSKMILCLAQRKIALCKIAEWISLSRKLGWLHLLKIEDILLISILGASTSIQFWIELYIIDISAIWTRAQNCAHHPLFGGRKYGYETQIHTSNIHAGKLCEMR